jgi:hypothetical protein
MRCKRLSLRLLVLCILPLVLLIVVAVIGYRLWRDSQTLPLPAAADIHKINLAIMVNVVFNYELSSSQGNELVHLFRDSVARQPNPSQNAADERKISNYSLCVVDKNGKEFCLFFDVRSNVVNVRDAWAKYSFYEFPQRRVPQLLMLVQRIISSKETIGGRRSHIPDGDASHLLYNLFSKKLSDGSTLKLERNDALEISTPPKNPSEGLSGSLLYVPSEILWEHYRLTNVKKSASEIVWEKKIHNLVGFVSGIGPSFVFWDAAIHGDKAYILYSERLSMNVDVMTRQTSGQWTLAKTSKMNDRVRCWGKAEIFQDFDKISIRYVDEKNNKEEWNIIDGEIIKRDMGKK